MRAPSPKKNMIPVISVLLPVYNGERYLRAALESILSQTFDDFELLTLDDGSSDRSLSILREFEACDVRVRVYSRQNRGLVPTLNELIAVARGRYLARMDSDDICRPQRFERQVAYLETHPECVAVGSVVLCIDPQGLPICELVNKLTHEEIDSAHLSGIPETRMCHPSVIMRKDAVLRVGRYREEYPLNEDLDLFLRLGEIGRLANLSEVLLEYRLHPKSICHTRGDKHFEFGRRAVQDAWMRRGMVFTPEIFTPTSKPENSADTHRRLAWWALSAGNLTTARKHALIAVARDPIRGENLKALACAIRGY